MKTRIEGVGYGSDEDGAGGMVCERVDSTVAMRAEC